MSRRPDLSKDRVLVIAGGVLPTINSDPCHMRRCDSPQPEENTAVPSFWVEIDREPPPDIAVQHPSKVCCRADIEIGTIDELVQTYREKLTKAVEMYLFNGELDAEEDPTSMKVWDGNEKFQARIAKLIEQGLLMRDHSCWRTSWDHKPKAEEKV